MLRVADGVQQTARDPAPLRGLMRIGAADTFAARVLPTLLNRVAQQHPSLQIDVMVESSIRLETLLLDRQIDIAFMSQPRMLANLRVASLWPIELVWVAGRKLGLQDGAVTPADLAELPIFTNPAPSNLYSTIQCWFAERGLQPRRLNTCNPLHIIARLTSAGTGVALLPAEVIEDCPERDELCILTADPPVPTHQQCAVWWANEAEEECALLADLAREIKQLQGVAQA